MRVFQEYNPVHIARHVKTLFKGHLYIKNIGEFEFDMGKIQLPVNKDISLLNVMSEINRCVSNLQSE